MCVYYKSSLVPMPSPLKKVREKYTRVNFHNNKFRVGQRRPGDEAVMIPNESTKVPNTRLTAHT